MSLTGWLGVRVDNLYILQALCADTSVNNTHISSRLLEDGGWLDPVDCVVKLGHSAGKSHGIAIIHHNLIVTAIDGDCFDGKLADVTPVHHSLSEVESNRLYTLLARGLVDNGM